MPARQVKGSKFHGNYKARKRRHQSPIFEDRAPLLFHLERKVLIRLSEWCDKNRVTRSKFLCDIIEKELNTQDPYYAVLQDLTF
jgi:hypothetical protein